MVRHLMHLDPEIASVVALDPALAAVVERLGPPPAWHRPPGFATLVLQILEQQVSLGAAAAHFARMREAAGGTVTPEAVLALDDATLRAAGVSRQKARYVKGLAADLQSGALDLDAVALADDAAARRMLTGVVGIGPWTADVHLIFVLRRPDLFPAGDRALQVGVAEVLGIDSAPSAAALAALAHRWAPHRSAAARIVWHAYLTRRGRTM